jgi:hypothetical protein
MANERRETERAIAYWAQQVASFGYPALAWRDRDFEHLMAEGGASCFVIARAAAPRDHLLVAYGSQFAHLLGLHAEKSSCVRLVSEIPDQLSAAFLKGVRVAASRWAPVRVDGAIDLSSGRRQLYRAVFMPIGRDAVFGAFNVSVRLWP